MRAPFRRLSAALTLAVAFTAITAAPAFAEGSFVDDDGNTHEQSIEAIVVEAITLGCGDFAYCPTELVTRGQMASFLARAFDLPTATADHFPDDAGAHEDNINRIAEAGITSGFADGTYRPDGVVSREQVASFLARALGLSPLDGNSFRDVSGIHAGNIYAVAADEITLGCSADGTLYCPSDPVRRDQMASFLARALDLPLFPVPDAIYDADLERCVVETTIEISDSLGTGMMTLEYEPQGVIAREDAAVMASFGIDWSDNVPAPRFLTDELLAIHNIGQGHYISEGTVQGLNADCDTLVDRIAPSAETTPGLYFIGAGAVIDPATGWTYTTIYAIHIVESP
ncbi:MAG: S-layer homology domain-containing protein [Acidimicrobiia bacterium]|nr:S-layer homology domain-containing protein [Acidimicrobiia bacterium]